MTHDSQSSHSPLVPGPSTAPRHESQPVHAAERGQLNEQSAGVSLLTAGARAILERGIALAQESEPLDPLSLVGDIDDPASSRAWMVMTSATLRDAQVCLSEWYWIAYNARRSNAEVEALLRSALEILDPSPEPASEPIPEPPVTWGKEALPLSECLVLYGGWTDAPMTWVHVDYIDERDYEWPQRVGSAYHRCRATGERIELDDVVAWMLIPARAADAADTERPPAPAPSSVEADMAAGVTLTEALRRRGLFSRTSLDASRVGRVVCRFDTGEPVALDESGGEVTFGTRDAWNWLKEQEGKGAF